MLTLIQKKYDFTDYQIAQLKYTFTILFSELSKFLIISFFFRDCLALYLYAAVLLGILRISTGGLHAKTYWGCLLMSLLFFYASIYLLPQISIPKILMEVLLLGCAASFLVIGPVPSVYRTMPTDRTKKRLITQSLITVSVQFVLFWLFNNKVFVVGSWIIILQTIQLVMARICKEVRS